MSSDIEKIAREIASDKRSGATALAARALDALEALAESFEENDPDAEATTVKLAARISSLRPSMGAIGAQAALAVAKAMEIADRGLPWTKALAGAARAERERLLGADALIASHARGQIGTGGAIVSCSYSQTAKETILELAPELVVMGEGHRMADGVRAAAELAAAGLKVRVTPDGALPVAVKNAKAVIVGADEVLADGSVVNRCSSFSLALAATHFGVPFFVVCNSIKLTGNKKADIEESDGLWGVPPDGVEVSAPIFDLTPPGLVYRVITESGLMTPAQAGASGLATAARCEEILGKR